MSEIVDITKKLPIEGIDFDFVEVEDSEISNASKNPILVLRTKDYLGVVVQYGKIDFRIEDTPPTLAFDFNILYAPEGFTMNALQNDNQFKNLLGDIITVVVENYIEERLKLQDESRNNNPQAPNL
jgi:hypothetical protein